MKIRLNLLCTPMKLMFASWLFLEPKSPSLGYTSISPAITVSRLIIIENRTILFSFPVFTAIGLTSRSGQGYQDDIYSPTQRASLLFSEMGKAVHQDPRPLSSNSFDEDYY